MKAYIEEVLKVGHALVRTMGIALGLAGEEADVFVRATERSFLGDEIDWVSAVREGGGGDKLWRAYWYAL